MRTLAFVACIVVAVPSLRAQTGQHEGELSPHFRGKSFQYVGDFHKNYAYIAKDEEGKLGGALAGGTYVADVISAREQVFLLFRKPMDGQLAMVDLSDPESRK